VPAERVKVPVPVYGAVPPVAATVTVNVALVHPLDVAVAVAESAGGCVIVTAVVAVQLFASVTVNV